MIHCKIHKVWCANAWLVYQHQSFMVQHEVCYVISNIAKSTGLQALNALVSNKMSSSKTCGFANREDWLVTQWTRNQGNQAVNINMESVGNRRRAAFENLYASSVLLLGPCHFVLFLPAEWQSRLFAGLGASLLARCSHVFIQMCLCTSRRRLLLLRPISVIV